MSNSQRNGPKPEPWLRGALIDVPAEQRAILHALQLAAEDVERWCVPLTQEELSARPHSLPPIAFHLRHILGSLDRLLTYAEAKTLSEEQKQWMAAEMDTTTDREQLLHAFQQGIAAAESRIRAIEVATWSQSRAVGRKQLPTTVAGLLIHCADHSQRHVGQAITTAKILLALREKNSFSKSTRQR